MKTLRHPWMPFVRTIKTALLTIAGTGLLLSSTSAFATDGKLYSAASCQAINGNHPSNYVFGTFNHLNFPTSLRCPIVRDVTTKGIKKAWIRVVDAHFTENVECTLYSLRTDVNGLNGMQGFWSTKSTSGSDSAVQALEFGNLDHHPNNSQYLFSCKVPAAYQGGSWSGVTGYYVEEK